MEVFVKDFLSIMWLLLRTYCQNNLCGWVKGVACRKDASSPPHRSIRLNVNADAHIFRVMRSEYPVVILCPFRVNFLQLIEFILVKPTI